eukprot:jgi/Botrbrau1/16198/Bobra.354_1s0005.1
MCLHVCVSTRVCLRGNVLVLDYWCFLNTYQKFGIANGAWADPCNPWASIQFHPNHNLSLATPHHLPLRASELMQALFPNHSLSLIHPGYWSPQIQAPSHAGHGWSPLSLPLAPLWASTTASLPPQSFPLSLFLPPPFQSDLSTLRNHLSWLDSPKKLHGY